MPSIPNAIVVNAAVVPVAALQTQWGIPAIVGESTYATKNTPTLYTSLATVQTDHGAASDITVAAEAIFAQGARRLYAVAATVSTAGSPTPTEIETALATLTNHATNRLIHGVCLAGIYSDQDTLTAKLKTFADAKNLIFTVTNVAGATVGEIAADTAALSSANGFFLAHNDATFTSDLGAAALGKLMVLKPWVTPYWKIIECDVDGYFDPSDEPTLETAEVNYVADLGDGLNRISNALLTKSDNSPMFVDITRTKYYLMDSLQSAIAIYRMNTEKIPYTPVGLKFIEGEIRGALEAALSAGAISEYSISMPEFDDIADADKENRRITGITVQVTLSGDIHQFALNLTVEAI